MKIGNWGAAAGLGVTFVFLTGCAQTGLTKPPRSATEQLLISEAATEALEKADFSYIRGRKVFVDRAYFESHDKDYVLGTIRDFVSLNDGLLMVKAEEAEVIIEPRSAALSIDASSSIIGIPQSTAPVPFAGSIQLPELALFKSEKQFSIAKLALLAYDQASRKHIHSSGPLVGRANIKYYKLLGYLSYTKTTLPEKKRQKEEKQ